MPIFHRNFTHGEGSDTPGRSNPLHLANVGPRLPVQVAVADSLASTYADRGEEVPSPTEGFALFDTGASVTCADESILRGIGLSPVGTAEVSTPSGHITAKTYVCALYFPGSPLPDMEQTFVIGAQLQNQNYAVLIGRDILQNMILIYDGPGARITYAF